MVTAARYFDLVREMKQNIYNHRLRLVESAKQRGIKPTARLFATTAPTVRKWLRRFLQHGPSGLLEHSRARHHQHLKTPATLEAQLVELRKRCTVLVLAGSSASSICPSATVLSSASGASMA